MSLWRGNRVMQVKWIGAVRKLRRTSTGWIVDGFYDETLAERQRAKFSPRRAA